MMRLLYASYRCLRCTPSWGPTATDEPTARLQVERHLKNEHDIDLDARVELRDRVDALEAALRRIAALLGPTEVGYGSPSYPVGETLRICREVLGP